MYLVINQKTYDQEYRRKYQTDEESNKEYTHRVGADRRSSGIVHIENIGTILSHGLLERILFTLVQQLGV